MRSLRQLGSSDGRATAAVGLAIALAAMALLFVLVLAPAADRGFNVPVAEAARPKVRILGLMYHDFGFGSPVTVEMEKEPRKAHFQPGPDNNHGPVTLADGDTLFIEVDSGEADVGTRTFLQIAGKSLIMIHTSCSKPLEVGFFYGPDGDETAENLSEFGGAGFQSGFEVIELVLTSNEPSRNCVQATATPTPTNTPVSEVSPTIVAPTSTPTKPPPDEKGDVNCDGKVNSRDALMMLQLNAGLKSGLPCIQNADVSQDGRINARDAALTLQFHVGLLNHLPA